jgi:hypothetical protein
MITKNIIADKIASVGFFLLKKTLKTRADKSPFTSPKPLTHDHKSTPQKTPD